MATLQERLAEAEDAKHKLATGRAVAEVRDQNGETIRYTPANAWRLNAYIEGLRSQINGPGTILGPMRVFF